MILRNKSMRNNILTLIIGLMVAISSCAGFHLQEKKNEMRANNKTIHSLDDAKIDAVVDSIESCPAWSALKKEDDLLRKQILICLEQISKNDLTTIRTAMEKYISMKESQNAFDIASMSRLFVLNRYIFDVPVKAKFDGPRFGGWIGVPYNSKEISLLWPLSFDKNGKLTLTGTYGGYNGDDYLALREFDYFKKKYGARKR